MLTDHVGQAVFGDAVGISQPVVSKMISDGILPAGGTFGEWLLAYCYRLREQAAGRLGSELGGLDLVQERAALAREQRVGQAMKNAIARKEYAPIQLLAQVLASASQAVSERFDHLPGVLKKSCPEMTSAQRNEVVGVIVAARNEWVRATAELVAASLDEIDDDLALAGDESGERVD